MGFILDGLDTEDYDRNYSDMELLRRIVAYFVPHKWRMLVVAITLTFDSIGRAAGPVLVAEAIDLVADKPSPDMMLLASVAISLLGVVAWGFNFVMRMIGSRVIGDVVLKLRSDVFNATINLDLSFYDEHPSGKVVSRVTSDTRDFSMVIELVVNLIGMVFLVVVLTLWLLAINAGLTLLLIGMTPIAVLIALSFRKIARQVTQNARRVTAKINAQIQESVSGIVVAKSFRQEHAIYDTFAENNRLAFRAGLQRGLTMNTIFPIMGAASGMSVAVLAYFGAISTREGGLSPGDWYLFMTAVGFYWFPMMNIASFWSQFQDGLSSAERVFALIDAESNVNQVDDQPVAGLEGRITFEHLRLSYTGEEVVLSDFNLDIRPKETVALVGHTGAGTSSIARMVARFYEFQEGGLLVDGRDVRALDLKAYRRQIGMVPQEPFLFSGTVADNIRYAVPDASDEAVCAAAEQISRGEWLADLPDGLETDVGERGASLSMGQRQLVALARVILKDPAIFILDEATASVDPFTETQIQEGLELIMADRTAIVIAHRLSTVKHADRIIVMDHGAIIEEGTHDQLMAQGGHYAELYNTYFRHQSLAYIEQFGR